MNIMGKTFSLLFLVCFVYSCNNHSTGNGAVTEGSNKDDQYQRSGYGDSIPSDSVKELVRQDSIRISKSNHQNK